MQAHQFTGIWRKWQKQYNHEDPHCRDKFLAANIARIEAKLVERAIKKKKAEAAGSLVDQQQAGADAESEAQAETETETVIKTELLIAQFAELIQNDWK